MSTATRERAARPCVVVAALSARWLAEAGRHAGYTVLALDAFGDADTRAASEAWWPIGDPSDTAPRVHPQRLRAALLAASIHAQEQGWHMQGWVAGPGCEPVLDDVLSAPDASLPDWRGNSLAACRHTREPSRFFALLDRLGLPYPPTRASPPQRLEGWLRKDLGLSGGWGVTPAFLRQSEPLAGSASRADDPVRVCWQADLPGEPWSLQFLAGAQGIRVLGAQRQHTCAIGARPYVFAGLSGPLPAPAGLAEAWSSAAWALTQALGLRGLCSLDLVVEPAAREWHIVELNPRPSASLQLYAHWPVLRWHLDAFVEGRLPGSGEMPPGDTGAARAWRVVYTPQPLSLPPGALAQAARSLAEVRCHDLPSAEDTLSLPAGAPLCSLSLPLPAHAGRGSVEAEQAQAALAQAEARLFSTCTTLSP